MKHIAVLLFVTLLTSFALVGCNTVRGIGQDIEKAGEGISGAAAK